MNSIPSSQVENISTRDNTRTPLLKNFFYFVNGHKSSKTPVLRCCLLRVWSVKKNRCIAALSLEKKKQVFKRHLRVKG
ncbi:hypothetical protein SADUNF_Sadunf07G0114100 [Salix dunnii]|uniref:Uncharacterized protein n=1 Tax=Salix dunnii TaxID=1413687 RepID=A0A835K0H6_9ROSI|nr:hypothetical protein SADUNF_Sadunf07G0114100 [Salix dunnii]